MNCPQCGGKASLVGLPAGIYPAAYRCYAHGEYNFSARGADADREAAESRALSRSNALAMATAERSDAPKELLGVYAKHCPFGHVMPIGDPACTICQDNKARDLEAGRTGNEPDYEGEDHGND